MLGALAEHVLGERLLVGNPCSMVAVEATMRQLIPHGGGENRKLAGLALSDIKEVRAGRKRVGGVIWGARRGVGGFAGQDMQAGFRHFAVVDFGEVVHLDAMAHRLTGTVEKKEREKNQCAALHISAAMARRSRGGGKTIPTMGIIYHQ